MKHFFSCRIGITLLSVWVAQAAWAQFTEPDAVVIHDLGVAGGNFGWAVSELSDIDGDGVTDLIVGDTGNSTAYVYSGRTGQQLLVLAGNGNLGYAVADAGDVNGDGVNDIVAGSTATNSATVFSGVDGAVIRTLNGETVGDAFGAAVSSAGDVNGDGQADVLVGANNQGPGMGRAYVFSGANGQLLRTLDGVNAGDQFGAGTGLMGDVNGDGVADHIISAPQAGNHGRVFVYSGSTGAELYVVDGDEGARQFGTFFVAGLGDVNADGTPDGYVGDYAHAGSRGRAYVFSGVDGTILHRFTGDLGDGLGPGRGAGDVDGDGHADLIVGEYTAGSNRGQAVVYSGLDGAVLQTFTHTVAGAQFGFDAVGVGDLNGDQRLDYLVSAASGQMVYAMAGNVEPRSSFTLNPGLNGAWFNPATNGQGIFIEVLPSVNQVLIAMFTFDAQVGDGSDDALLGSENQRWFTALGPITNNTASFEVFNTVGGIFDDPTPVTVTSTGTMMMVFTDCIQATLTYEFPEAGISGEMPMTRVSGANVPLCESYSESP